MCVCLCRDSALGLYFRILSLFCYIFETFGCQSLGSGVHLPVNKACKMWVQDSKEMTTNGCNLFFISFLCSLSVRAAGRHTQTYTHTSRADWGLLRPHSHKIQRVYLCFWTLRLWNSQITFYFYSHSLLCFHWWHSLSISFDQCEICAQTCTQAEQTEDCFGCVHTKFGIEMWAWFFVLYNLISLPYFTHSLPLMFVGLARRGQFWMVHLQTGASCIFYL